MVSETLFNANEQPILGRQQWLRTDVATVNPSVVSLEPSTELEVESESLLLRRGKSAGLEELPPPPSFFSN